jgi:hypothetical protein
VPPLALTTAMITAREASSGDGPVRGCTSADSPKREPMQVGGAGKEYAWAHTSDEVSPAVR